MKKSFSYTRISNSGNPYQVNYTVEVTRGRVVISESEFSLREIFRENLKELHAFIVEAMDKYGYVIRKEKNRENHGHPTHPINRGGVYYSVDGKLYRCDKRLCWANWSAPVSDVRRILDELMDGADDTYGVTVKEI